MIELAIVCYITRRQNFSKQTQIANVTTSSCISPILRYHPNQLLSTFLPAAQLPPYQLCALNNNCCNCCHNNSINNDIITNGHSFSIPKYHDSNVYLNISTHENTCVLPNDNGLRLRSFGNGICRSASPQTKERSYFKNYKFKNSFYN